MEPASNMFVYEKKYSLSRIIQVDSLGEPYEWEEIEQCGS